jgi:CO/xanthine dehydrogenase FAD-binding subunit
VALADFLTGPGSTLLQPSEMVTGLAIPCLPEEASTSFLRITRVAADLAKVNVAVMIRRRGNVCLEARIALGGVAPTAFRSRRSEDFLKGKVLDREAIEQSARLASQESRPITDVRSSLEYRREMCQVLVSRAITNCVERVQG